MPKRGLKEAPSVARNAGRRARQNERAARHGPPEERLPQQVVLDLAGVLPWAHARRDPAGRWVRVVPRADPVALYLGREGLLGRRRRLCGAGVVHEPSFRLKSRIESTSGFVCLRCA